MSSFLGSPRAFGSKLAGSRKENSPKQNPRSRQRKRQASKDGSIDGTSSFNSSVSALTRLNSQFSDTPSSNGASTGPRNQKHGFLWKRAFRKNASKQGSWRKQWFMLQESFLVWYSKRPRYRFDVHPAGCLPMGGCQIFQLGKLDKGFGFEVSHPSFEPGVTLVLKSDTLENAQSWIEEMQACQKATIENCTYGDAVMQKLATGTKENERIEEILREAKANAEKAAQIAAENIQIMEDHLDKVAAYEEELEEVLNKTESLNRVIEKEEKSAVRKRNRIGRFHSKTKETKKELLEARKALEMLESHLITQPREKRVELEQDMRDLREYIDSVVPPDANDLDWDEF
mmetsp:Transcript_640/g.774  ORF Transcript_640/g.774 Transcript_640/m.774 type:complete len:344 (+) Transcript_640:371-1402(+)